jgi:hypothetical protein
MEWLTCGWIATQDPKDQLWLGVVQVKVWLRCGWLGARDPAKYVVVDTACAPVYEGRPQVGFGTAGRCSTIFS